MGWDAYSTPYSTRFDLPEYKAASDRVVAETGTVDGLLDEGGLDVSTCAHMLQKATGQAVWTENPWAPEFVQTLATQADWDFDVSQDEAWAKASAKAFLETTAALGRGVSVSF